MISNKELFEFQENTAKHYRKAIRVIRENFTITKMLDKHIETIIFYLETYEIMYDTLYKIREVSSTVMESNELETIEREMKVLIDTFWE